MNGHSLALRRAAPALAAAAALGAAELRAQDAERFTLRDERAAVYNLAGEVRVEPGSGSDVVVEVTPSGADARELRVQRGTRDGAGTVTVVYPGDRVVYPRIGRGSRTQLTVQRDGSFGGGGGRLFGGGARRVNIAGSGRGTEAWADVRVQVPAGRSVAIHQGVGRVEVSNVRGELRVRTASAAVRASGTRGSLDVDVGSGGVEVRDAEGTLSLDTGSGGVRLANVRGPSLLVDTGSGGVDGADIEVERLMVDVGSGGVELAQVGAREVEIDTGSGSVELSLTRDARSVVIDTGSGGVTLGLPRDFGAQLEIDTGSGGIRVDVPVEARRASRNNFLGRMGDGDGRVLIDTGSGGVRVVQN